MLVIRTEADNIVPALALFIFTTLTHSSIQAYTIHPLKLPCNVHGEQKHINNIITLIFIYFLQETPDSSQKFRKNS